MKLVSYLFLGACIHAPFFISAQTKTRFDIGALVRMRAHTAHWLVMVYIAADNNLDPYVDANLKQLLSVGSNDRVTIVVQLNRGGTSPTRRFLVLRNRSFPLLLNSAECKLDSGSKKTLSTFCIQTIKNFPARNVCLIVSSHGSGYVDIKDLKEISEEPLKQHPLRPAHVVMRSLCEDATYKTTLKNNDICDTFKTIYHATGRIIDLVGLDACSMQMLEVGMLLAPYARFLVGSQEVELADGWDYARVLQPLSTHTVDAATLAKHIVTCYQQQRVKDSHRHTLSAIDLHGLSLLERTTNRLSELLLQCLKLQRNHSLTAVLRCCNSARTCPCFMDGNYIDIGCFFSALLNDLAKIEITNVYYVESLKQTLERAIQLLEQTVIANSNEHYFTATSGLSVYFPQKKIHSSYRASPFALKNQWITFLDEYARKRQEYIDAAE